MARVTVEDCLEHVDNRFTLVMRATRRARQIHRGSEPQVDAADDKPTVIALREIAGGGLSDEFLDQADEIYMQEEEEEPALMVYGTLGDDQADDF